MLKWVKENRVYAHRPEFDFLAQEIQTAVKILNRACKTCDILLLCNCMHMREWKMMMVKNLLKYN